jgi:anti-anti-sigma factor
MLRIDMQSWNGVATLHCAGRLVFGVETEMLRAMVQARPEACIRINLARVDTIDAAGLGLLVELQAWARETKRSLLLLDLSEHVWALVILTKLCASLDISYSDVAAAFERDETESRRKMIA